MIVISVEMATLCGLLHGHITAEYERLYMIESEKVGIRMLNGIINIYKKKGFTSHDVVAKARGILRERKIGHTGTLDPDAEGVLPLCIGMATKVVPYLSDANKCYEAEVVLGTTTTTEDASGEVLEHKEVTATKEMITEVVNLFIGSYIQTPPMYSAIKVNGVRLYELARKGIVVERPSREVTIYGCDIIEWIDEKRFKIRVSCSKGTYIRTLCTDIGSQLGCGAHMGTLLRLQVGQFKLEDSMTLEQLEAYKDNLEHYIVGIEELFAMYPIARITKMSEKLLFNGNALRKRDIENFNDSFMTTLIRVADTSNRFVALYKWDLDKSCFKVERMFYNA